MFVPLRYMYLRNFPFFSVNNIFPAGGSLALSLLGTAEVEGGRGRPSKGGNGKARRRRRFKKDVRRPQEGTFH